MRTFLKGILIWKLHLTCYRAGQREEYVYGYLEEIVKVSKAPRLNLRILSENKRIKNIPKLLASDYVEQLHVSASCTFR